MYLYVRMHADVGTVRVCTSMKRSREFLLGGKREEEKKKMKEAAAAVCVIDSRACVFPLPYKGAIGGVCPLSLLHCRCLL